MAVFDLCVSHDHCADFRTAVVALLKGMSLIAAEINAKYRLSLALKPKLPWEQTEM